MRPALPRQTPSFGIVQLVYGGKVYGGGLSTSVSSWAFFYGPQ